MKVDDTGKDKLILENFEFRPLYYINHPKNINYLNNSLEKFEFIRINLFEFLSLDRLKNKTKRNRKKGKLLLLISEVKTLKNDKSIITT